MRRDVLRSTKSIAGLRDGARGHSRSHRILRIRKAFQIQASTDGSAWTTVYSTTTGTGGTQTLPVTGTGRYIRMYGTARATQYGYSLWEFQVYGT